MLKCKKLAKITAAVAIAGLVTFGYDVLAETQEERLQKERFEEDGAGKFRKYKAKQKCEVWKETYRL